MDRRPNAQSRIDTVVVGGGIVGICLACFLAEEGVETAILDAGRAGGTMTNAGSLHVQMQSRFMQLHPHLIDAMESTLHLYPKAVRFWQALEKTLGATFDLRVTGGLMVAESPEQLDFLAHKAERERALGLELEILDRGALEEVAPYLGAPILGAELCHMEGKLNPLLANAALHDWRRKLGVPYLSRAVLRIERDGGGFLLHTAEEPISRRPRGARHGLGDAAARRRP